MIVNGRPRLWHTHMLELSRYSSSFVHRCIRFCISRCFSRIILPFFQPHVLWCFCFPRCLWRLVFLAEGYSDRTADDDKATDDRKKGHNVAKDEPGEYCYQR